MTVKHWITIILTMLCTFSLSGLEPRTITTSVTVLDENGKSIKGADVTVTYPPYNENGSYVSGEGLTDENGTFLFTGKAYLKIFVSAGKDSYYPSRAANKAIVYDESGNQIANHPEIALVLKKMINPVHMYAIRETIVLPKGFVSGGYDLIERDWVPPIGIGKIADLIFTVASRYASESDFETNLKISFTNEGDGLFPFYSDKDNGSTLRSVQTAPLEGYEPYRTITRARISNIDDSGTVSVRAVDQLEKNINYLLRIRSVINDNGEIESAIYGKIYGEFEFGGELSPEGFFIKLGSGGYYINPNRNDRSLEFDSKRNLFKDLEPRKQVFDP